MEKLFYHPIAHLCAEIKEWIPQTGGVGVLKFGCMLPKAPAGSKISPKPTSALSGTERKDLWNFRDDFQIDNYNDLKLHINSSNPAS